MTTLVYDHAPDVSESSVIHAAYWDNESKTLYLVFNNGTTVSRRLPTGYESHHLDVIFSWGSWWNNYLKRLPEGERVENGANFVHREQAPVTHDVPSDNDDGTFGSLGQTVTSIPSFAVDDSLVDIFVKAYDNYEDAHLWAGSHEEAVRAGLEAVAACVNAEAAAAQESPAEPETAETNGDGTFIGIGFFDVPEAVRPALSRTVEFFDELVQETIGNVETHVETYTKKALRDAFKRWVS